MNRRFTRRDLLKAAGCSLAVPAFVRLAFATESKPLPRLFLLMQTNGTSQPDFWPDANLSSTILDALFAETSLKSKAIVIKGLYNRSGGAGTPHDQGFAGLYSGYRTTGRSKAEARGGGISIDQFLRQRLDLGAPRPTLNCGVLTPTYPKSNDNRISFSYSGARRQVPCEGNVYKLYERFFAPPEPVSEELAAQRRRLDQSVLDAVAADLGDLGRRLGPEQRTKLDLHVSALRDFERRLNAAPWKPSRAQCASAAAAAAEPGVPDRGDEHTPTVTRLMLDFIALAASCNLTRIVTFQFGKGGEHFRYPFLGIDPALDGHTDIAHADKGDPAIRKMTVTINEWYASQVRYLCAALDAVPEGDGTALDSSLVVWGNEQANGVHDLENIPVVLLGGAAGRIQRSGYLLDEGEQDYHRLGCTLLNVMGVPSTGFGEEPDCGPLSGLAVG